MLKRVLILMLLSSFALLVCSYMSLGKTDAISLSFTSKVYENKKHFTVVGDVYFKKLGGVLTTHLIKPFENVTIINSDGEMKNYDVLDNVLMLSNSALTSSESSYFWHFFNGNYNDLGIGKLGYVIKGTKQEDGLMVTNWVPKSGVQNPIRSIELVHEKSLPIFLGFFDVKNRSLGKIYFSAYQKVGETHLPFKITEISYKEKNDSIIIYKTYSNPKLNDAVDKKYLEFKIPSNAKVLSGK